jgi:hypothetical protein
MKSSLIWGGSLLLCAILMIGGQLPAGRVPRSADPDQKAAPPTHVERGINVQSNDSTLLADGAGR